MSLKNVHAALLFVLTLMGWGCSYTGPRDVSISTPSPSPTATSAESTATESGNAEERPRNLVRKSGWLELDRSKLDVRAQRKSTDDGSLFVTRFVPKSPMLLSMKCRNVAEFGELCHRSPMGHEYYVHEFWVFDLKGNAFAVNAMMKRTDQMDTAAMYIRLFVDTDGDGRFETLSFAEMGEELKNPPKWAKR